jgi:predicted lipoprotein
MRLLLTLAFALAATPALAQSAIPVPTIIAESIDGYIRPAFAHLAEEAGTLAHDVAGLCATPADSGLAAARQQFGATALAYARAEFLRIGPLGSGDRMERLLFWPDRKGIALRQVQAALAEADPTAAAPETLRRKSVAMQGLVAVEYLLFGTGSDDLAAGAAYRCSYAAAATTLIAGLAGEIDAEWRDTGPAGIAARLTAPTPEADDYRTETEVLEKLAATLIHGTETIRDQRVMPVLGAAQGGPKPRSALFWRSGLTVPALAANFAGLHDFFVAAGFPEAMAGPNEWVSNGALFEFQNAARAAALITAPIEQAVADAAQLQALKYMVIITGSLDTLLGDNLAAALGLSVGFSALDGD